MSYRDLLVHVDNSDACPARVAAAVGLAVATALLSVLQRSEPLIVIGLLGGFAAPVLASTGEGSHVALFSYYAVLIVATTAVASA